MIVETDDKSGFCFGVQNAVEIAEKVLLKGEEVYSLGPIVHNDMEVKRLVSIGLITINREKLGRLKNCNLLIRAHGEPPETYLTAAKNNINIIDATCPIVKKLQLKIRDSWLRYRETKGQIVIYGKPGHDEVVGLLGQTKNEGILISEPDDLVKIDFTRPVALFSQTTMSISKYHYVAEQIRAEMIRAGISDTDNYLKVNNTICGQVSGREPHLKTFARKHDIIIFVSGRESSNGKLLYAACKSVNPETYFVSSPDEIDKSWFEGKKTAGICGATSTPKWLIEDIKDLILKF